MADQRSLILRVRHIATLAALLIAPATVAGQLAPRPPAAAECTHEGPGRRIAGLVLENATGRPLPYVQVGLGRECLAITDSTGRFTLLDVPTGALVARANFIGYVTEEASVLPGVVDDSSLVFTMRRPGEPAEATGPPLTKTDMKAVIQLLLANQAQDQVPVTRRIADAAADASGNARPTGHEGPMGLVLVYSPYLRWASLARQQGWDEEWVGSGLLRAFCEQDDRACGGEPPVAKLTLGDPIPTHADTAFVALSLVVQHTARCREGAITGDSYQSVLRVVREADGWRVRPVPHPFAIHGAIVSDCDARPPNGRSELDGRRGPNRQ